MGEAASEAVGSAGQGRGDRLGEIVVRLGERPRSRGGKKTGPNPTDKAKKGSKHHIVVVDRQGIPLAVIHSANVHDSKVLEEVVDAIEPINKPRGRARKRPKKLHAYTRLRTYPRCREALSKRGITPRIARRGIDSSEKLGRYRWVSWNELSVCGG